MWRKDQVHLDMQSVDDVAMALLNNLLNKFGFAGALEIDCSRVLRKF